MIRPADRTASFRAQDGNPPSSAAPRPGAYSEGADSTPPDPLAPLKAHLAEAKVYFQHMMTAKADRMKAAARSVALLAVLGIAGAIGGAVAIGYAVVLVLGGAARGIGAALGDRLWAGDLIVGTLILTVIALTLVAKIKGFRSLFHNQTTEKYAKLKAKQRAQVGRDVDQRAASL